MTHGGKRKGAGRKKRSVPRVALTIKVEPDVADQFRVLCYKTGKSQSQLLSDLVSKGL